VKYETISSRSHKIDIIGNNSTIANSSKSYSFLPGLDSSLRWNDAKMVLLRFVIPAKAGIQAKQSAISNNVYYSMSI
jgi:hypothetical protein